MATKRWTGGALPVVEKQTITVGGTWVADETATITINGKDLVLTVKTTVTTTSIASQLAAMWNGTALIDDEVRSETGNNVPEADEITATASGSVTTLTHDDKGVPFTISVSETSALGTLTLATSQAATGPNFWNNADNWDTGTVPAAADDIVFDQGNTDVKYALSQAGATLTTLTITAGYTGKIGLPEVNIDNAGSPYFEYRNKYLAIDATTVTIGGGEGNGSSRIKINAGTVATTVNVSKTGSREGATPGVPAIIWKGTNAANVFNVSRGDIGIAFFGGETATVATLRVGYLDNPAGDSRVECGSGTTLTTIDQSGGVLKTNSAATTVTMTDGQFTAHSGAHTTINVDGGTCFYRSTGTVTTLNVGGGGTADFGRDMRARTVTNATLYAGGRIRDPFKTVTWSNGVDLTRANIADVSLDLGTHVTLTPSAV